MSLDDLFDDVRRLFDGCVDAFGEVLDVFLMSLGHARRCMFDGLLVLFLI